MEHDMKDVVVNYIMQEEFGAFGFTSHQYPNAIGMWPNEQESLLWLALNAPLGNFMEIGSFCGGSAVLLCLAATHDRMKKRKVYSVDRTFTNWNKAFDRNVYRVGGFEDISVKLECDSAELDKHYNGNPLSLAFIDGWHSFAAVLRDFNTINKWLVPGGYAVFHDVAPQPYKVGDIERYYDRAKANFNQWTAKPLDVWSRKDVSLQEYHQSETEQDFFLDEAVAYIIKEYKFDLVHIPVLDGSTHFDRVPVYKHGTTSPYHGLVAIQKRSDSL